MGYYRPEDIERLEFVASLIPAGSRVLDVGAYDDALASACARVRERDNITVIGIDIVPEGGRVMAGDVCHLPFKDNAFDTVCVLEVLEHLTDSELKHAVREIRRVFTQCMVMSVPYEEVPLGAGHKQYFSEWKMIALFGLSRGHPRMQLWRMGKRQKYYGIREWLGRRDIRLTQLVNRVFGVKRKEGANWLVAKFSKR